MTTHTNVATVKSVALSGFFGEIIEVETDMKAGLPSLQIVGMGNKAIDEARQRVRSAISNSLLTFPVKKITVNLAPADLPKDGTHLDLPIALSILSASGQIKQNELKNALFAGELALDGTIRPIRGAITITEAARKVGLTTVYLPSENVSQASLVEGITIVGVSTLQALFKHLRGFKMLPTNVHTQSNNIVPTPFPTFDSIVGHESAKRALVIAAAGRHNILLSGPPGTGKTLLAKTIIGLLPPLTKHEKLEVTKLYSLSSGNYDAVYTHPPFRAPHHSVTLTALIGGGLKPKPGDISLSHKGVLFLDEMPEYPRTSLEALRQPLEDRSITLSRLYGSITYPADFLLIGTMNPCPCGYLGDTQSTCSCTAAQIAAYQKKLSGPLLDRIDIRIPVLKIPNEHFFDTNLLIKNQHFEVLNLISVARNYQKARYKRSDFYNAYASLEDAKRLFKITPRGAQLLNNASTTLNLSSRSYLRVLRLARTIADISSEDALDSHHVAEALQLRS